MPTRSTSGAICPAEDTTNLNNQWVLNQLVVVGEKCRKSHHAIGEFHAAQHDHLQLCGASFSKSASDPVSRFPSKVGPGRSGGRAHNRA
ncbi:MAG: hypothetical protein IPH31_05635 [Lewinellaceae bacterium]|nr:hypothetical protein [Lewinellaceae bacterium]